MTTTRTPSSTRPLEHADGFGLLLNSLRPAAPPAFTFQPAQPDIAALRQAARDIMEQSALDKRRDEAEYGYVELTTDEPRELIHVGALVRYHFSGYGRFEGIVTALCPETDRAQVKFEDNFGMRKFWCALDRLTLILTASAHELEANHETECG